MKNKQQILYCNLISACSDH